MSFRGAAASRPLRGGQTSAATFKLAVPEVLAAVRSLYADELKPFGRVLLKRLRERAAASAATTQGLPAEAVDPETMPRIDPKRLRRICQTSPLLRVDPEDGHEFSVILAGRPRNFLDVCSPQDPYPPQMWAEAAAYFENLCGYDMMLPGGRYACARVLVSRGLPFLLGRSLGQVCHVVQLAISQKHILGYLDGQLVPYWHSEEWVKEQHAYHQQPLCSKKGAKALPVASWEEARERLRELLNSESNPEPGVVTLSNVKRLFRSRFQLDLSETVLGHSRLFDLLHDPRFHDVCTVQAHGNGQLLVKRADRPHMRPELQVPELQVPELELPFPDVSYHFSSVPTAAPVAPPGVWNNIYMGSLILPVVSMHMNDLPPNLAVLREVDFDMGMDCTWGLSPGVSPPASPPPTPPAYTPNFNKWRDVSSAGESTDVPCREASSSSDELFHLPICWNMPAFTLEPSSSDEPLPAYRAHAVTFDASSGDESPVVSKVKRFSPSPVTGPGAVALDGYFGEILSEEVLNEEATAILNEGMKSGGVQWPVLSPSMLSNRRHNVKNTFIEIPAKAGLDLGARRRLRSVPKDMGSQKSKWETACHALLSPSRKYSCGAEADNSESDVEEPLTGLEEYI